MPNPPELVVLSHLRWSWVWQRPQHLVSRLAATHDVWFVEEPAVADVTEPVLRVRREGDVRVAHLDVPPVAIRPDFDGPHRSAYELALLDALGARDDRRVWLYTPAALELARALAPSVLAYDVMDDLSAFKGASPALALRHRQALRAADVVFAGGRSLHRSVAELRPHGTYLFPSGVEPEHFERAVSLRSCEPGARPLAGYVGVIDERVDLGLLAGLAGALPDWDLELVGPVAKIDPADLPQAPNVRYLGQQPYERLPEILARFDVALMPFARNEATRSISPTKTLEYLAAGLPVVSTRVPDVVASYGDVVDLQDDATGFARACERVRGHDPAERRRRAEPLLEWQRWDTIAARMTALVEAHAAAPAREAGLV